MAKVGRGGFGEVSIVKDIDTGIQFALKIENVKRVKGSNPRLYFEYRIYLLFKSNNNFPNVYWYGEETRLPTEDETSFGSKVSESMMVMDKLRTDLHTVYVKTKPNDGRKFSDQQLADTAQ